MYRRPKFLEVLDEVRQEMSHEADYDVDLFAEIVRNAQREKTDGEIEKTVNIEKLFLEDSPKTKK